MKKRPFVVVFASLVAALVIGGIFMASVVAERGSYNPAQQGPEPATSVENAPEPRFARGTQVVRMERFAIKPVDWQERNTAEFDDKNGAWATQTGKLAQTGTALGDTGFDETMSLAPVNTDGSVTISTQVYPQGNQVVGLVFRASDAGYYLFRVFRGGEAKLPVRYQIQRYDAETGLYTILAEDRTSAGYDLGRWQELRVQLDGDQITGSFDGKQVLTATDATYTNGDAGVYTVALGDVFFDNFAVVRPQGQ